jgi:integrase
LLVGRTGNAIVYQTAVNRLIAFSSDDIALNKIDYKLLTGFIHRLKLEGLKTNSISNYLRSIRAIYNKAIKHKIVDRSLYPFYDISIKSQGTAKRAISKADVTKLISLHLEENSQSQKALNYFLLSFYLRGISFTDMAYLKRSNLINGRIHYVRRKTHKLYSIKLFAPADDIINNLHQIDQNYLLPVLPDSIVENSLEAKKTIKQWIKTTNKYLKRLSLEINCEISITTYCSRHSFATIAKHLGYSNELIAEALGHEHGNKITNIYLDAFDEDKLDAMHYDVIT